jgi:hypothetical protein
MAEALAALGDADQFDEPEVLEHVCQHLERKVLQAGPTSSRRYRPITSVFSQEAAHGREKSRLILKGDLGSLVGQEVADGRDGLESRANHGQREERAIAHRPRHSPKIGAPTALSWRRAQVK